MTGVDPMLQRIGLHTWIVVFLAASTAYAGTPDPSDGAPAASQTTAPPRPAPPDRSADQPLPPPFQLTAQEQEELDRLLDRWQQWNAHVKTFDCRFKRWTYDTVFGPTGQPKWVDSGIIKYAGPDHALFRLERAIKDGKEAPIEDFRAEHWMFDGKSVFELNAVKKQLIEHKLPPKYQGGRLVDGPLAFGFPAPLFFELFGLLGGSPAKLQPFPFGAKANELKQQSYIRAIAPPNQRNGIWLEAYPRFRQMTWYCQKLQLVFNAKDVSPLALMIVQPNGKDYTAYQFYDVVLNGPSSPANDDVFHPMAPLGWQKVIDEPPITPPVTPQQARRPAAGNPR